MDRVNTTAFIDYTWQLIWFIHDIYHIKTIKLRRHYNMWFILGLILGAICGFIVACLCVASSDN